MKKRLLTIFLVLIFVLTTAIPAFGAEQMSDKPAVQNAWEKYLDLKTALDGDDVEALKAAYLAGEEANGELTWEDAEEMEAADENFWSDFATAQVVIYVDEVCDAFVADKNAKTAKDFVDYYGMEDMHLYHDAIVKFIPDVDATFVEAQAMMPSEDIIKVYDAYMGLKQALEFWMFDDSTREAMAAMEAVLDIFNEMSEADLDVLAQMLEVEDGEAAWNAVFADWVDLNILASVDDVYQAYLANPSEDTAKAFVEYYEAVFPENPDDAAIDPELVRNFFIDIDAVYEDAQGFLAGVGSDGAILDGDGAELDGDGAMPETEAPGAPLEDDAVEPSEDETEKAPPTGDATSFLPLVVLLAASGAMVACRRRGVR